MANTILDVSDLNIEFHDHDLPETVVWDFDLMLDEGEIVGLVGESGSGKSMSAMAIAGLLPRHKVRKKGRITYGGIDLLTCSRDALRAYQGSDIGVIFQEPMTALDPLKKVGWQVEEPLKLHHPEIAPEERRRMAIDELRKAELEDPERVYDSYPFELSGGQRQRVCIAAAMIGNPRILIADEPTTALDVLVQEDIIALLQKINREEHVSILFISHDLSLVRQLCTRVLVMHSGRIVESGRTEEVF
ncbi:MAG: ABC transporter ATP-binding protein, partial [Lachnospiraceae bacterium]|nr:ABC transporter ATP-binding protein [Lachnospiraceae bacterium]